jgi:soluble lytic murein transglycosylase
LLGLLASAVLTGATAGPITFDDTRVQDAREAWRSRDKVRLLSARDALIASAHPLAPWADYWYFQLRLIEASPSEVDAFLARWPDSYVADRARNDWLLELGRRQDWRTFLRVLPSFRMNDDRDVSCLAVLAREATGLPTEGPGEGRARAQVLWWGQKDADFGCDAMAQALLRDGVLQTEDVWRKLRFAVELDRTRAVQQSARLLGDTLSQAVGRAMAQPQAFLMPKGRSGPLVLGQGQRLSSPGATIGPAPTTHETRKAHRRKHLKQPVNPAPLPLVVPDQAVGPLNLLAFIRWANMDPAAAAAAMQDSEARSRWGWNAEESSWAWAQLGRTAAWRLMPEAPSYFERALADRAVAMGAGELRAPDAAGRRPPAWSEETLAWMARTALRAAVTGQPQRWTMVEDAIDAMAPSQAQDEAWRYWRAKALQQHAKAAGASASGEAWRQQAREALARVANPLSFYGQLAAEEVQGAPSRPPAKPTEPSEADRAAALAIPGVDRALRLFDLGWRSEAVREWNFTLGYGRPGGYSDAELRTIAEVACQREIWDRCINTSDRTRQEFDLSQRYPMPFEPEVLKAAREVGLDPAYMYGLIRQESRFQMSVRSNVGAAGLMQVMPATAAWTARKLSIDYHPDRITDRMTNLRIGAGYLKLVLDDFQGAQALAAAAYNAGPNRPRRWRDGPRMDAAVWVENIPFNETRDYVKKVLANATVYAHLIDGKPLSVRARLGRTVGPRDAAAPPSEDDLP